MILDLSGDFDLYSAPAVRELIRNHITEGRKKLILNMEEVPYLDSSGVGTIIQSLQAAVSGKGQMVLTSLQRAPFRVLEMANITSIIKNFQSEKDALAFLDK